MEKKQSEEKFSQFKKGGLAAISEDIDPDFKMNPLFRHLKSGQVYRVFDVDDNGVYVGPRDAPEEDIAAFTPNKILDMPIAIREERYKGVILFEGGLDLLPVH